MKLSFHIPSWVSIALSVAAGVLVCLNVTTFGFAPAWQYLVTVGLSMLAAVGINPLTGNKLQTTLHLSHATVVAMTAATSTAALAVTTLSMNTTWKGIIAGVIALVGGVLFGTPTPVVPVVVPPATESI